MEYLPRLRRELGQFYVRLAPDYCASQAGAWCEHQQRIRVHRLPDAEPGVRVVVRVAAPPSPGGLVEVDAAGSVRALPATPSRGPQPQYPGRSPTPFAPTSSSRGRLMTDEVLSLATSPGRTHWGRGRMSELRSVVRTPP